MRKLTRLLVGMTVVAVTMFVGKDAAASGSATASLSVSAGITASCAVVAGTTLTLTGSPVASGNTTVGVTCTNGTSALITLGLGASPGSGAGTGIKRYLNVGGAGTAWGYNLYTDSGYTYIWDIDPAIGDYTCATGTTTGALCTGKLLTTTAYAELLAADGNSDTITIYGQTASNALLPAGTYTDTVAVTATF